METADAGAGGELTYTGVWRAAETMRAGDDNTVKSDAGMGKLCKD